MSAVFISYRREDNAHCARVRALGERLDVWRSKYDAPGQLKPLVKWRQAGAGD